VMNPETTLGPRRRQVFDLLSAGRSPREVARELDMSTQRVYQHIEKLRERGFLPAKGSAA
jgi:DNA-binding CsgD family transcriptional regulator